MTLLEASAKSKMIERNHGNKYGPLRINLLEDTMLSYEDIQANDWKVSELSVTFTKREFLNLLEDTKSLVNDEHDYPEVIRVLTLKLFGGSND